MTPASRGWHVLKTILYVLAGLVLALGLVTGFSLIGSAQTLAANLILPVQILGGGAISNLLSSLFSGFLINLGIVVIIVSTVLSLLLYAVGRLSAQVISLESRLARLEGGQRADAIS
jgi:hypothetical protein